MSHMFKDDELFRDKEGFTLSINTTLSYYSTHHLIFYLTQSEMDHPGAPGGLFPEQSSLKIASW